LKVSSILERKGDAVITIHASDTIRTAAGLMISHRIAALVVMSGGKVVGVISERDVVGALVQHGPSAGLVTAREIMSDHLVSVSPHVTIKRAMSLMTDGRVRHLPVIDGGGLVGIVSLGDIVEYRLEDLELESNVLRDVYIAAR
jgi:CBS domain-containing protein